ncbi:MAG TPA: class I SAM-dependent methyltransferase [Actinomycetota bacterium]|nr:class I SAM-dependent methyltransferase [Actinomycetota bacterium]
MREAHLTLPPLSLNAWLRYDLIERMLDDLPGVTTVLEVGAGQGAIGARLALNLEYTGVEPDAASYERAKQRLDRLGHGRIHRGYVADLPADLTFDLVCAFEVLEHIEDDLGALKEWATRARPGGYVMISSPAWPRRFGSFDRFAGHYRRYTREGYAELLREAGCEQVKVLTYGFLLGQVLERVRNAATSRKGHLGSMEERTAASGRWGHPARGDRLTKVASAPFRILQRPFVHGDAGTGFVAVGRRMH